MPGFLFMGMGDFEGAKLLSESAQPPPTTTFAPPALTFDRSLRSCWCLVCDFPKIRSISLLCAAKLVPIFHPRPMIAFPAWFSMILKIGEIDIS
jgi:hypothetical protein